jgi:fructose-bisphosphate aldolase class II
VLPEKGRAVGAFDVVGLEWAEAVLEGAEALGLPVILSVAPHLGGPPLKALAPGLRYLAEAARVPVALHLDHGHTLEEVVQALRLGFTGVMLDGSHLPLEENIRLTQLVVAVARACGAGVEGEVGVVPGHYGPEEDREEVLYTDPEEARRFLEETGVDALAVSVGTRHPEETPDWVEGPRPTPEGFRDPYDQAGWLEQNGYTLFTLFINESK